MVQNQFDSGSGGSTAPEQGTAAWFAYESAQLDSAARRVLGASDRVDALKDKTPLGGSDAYGHAGLAAEAVTYEARFRFLHEGLADELESAGYALRGTSETYAEVDAQSRSAFDVDLDYLLTGKKSQ